MGVIKKQTISGTIFTYLGAAIGFVTTGILFPRILEPDQIGLLSLLISYSTIFAQFGSLGFNSVTTRLFPYFRNKENKHNGFLFLAIKITLVGFLLALGVLFLYSQVILPEKKISSPLFANYFWLIAPLLFCTLYFMLFDNYSKVLFNAVRGIIIKEFIVRIIVLIGIILFYFSFLSFSNFVYYYVIAFCLPLVLVILLLLKDKQLFLRPARLNIDSSFKSEMASVSLYGFLISATGIITINIDRIMIDSLIPVNNLDAVGIYSTAFFFGTVVILPSRALIKISVAVIAEAWKNKEIDTIKEVYKKSTINLFIIGLLIFIGIWINIDNILEVLTNKYAEGKYVIFFIALAYLADMLSGVSNNILGTSKYYKVQAGIMLIMVLLVILTNYLLIPRYGIVGAAVASFISKLIVDLIRFIYLKWKFKLQPYSIKFIYVVIIGVSSFLIAYFIPGHRNLYLNVVIKSFSVTVPYIVLIYFVHCSNDFNSFIRSMLNKIKKFNS